MKRQCEEVVNNLIIKLQGQFLAQNLINGFGNVYPQYWLQLELETKFVTYLVVLKYALYQLKKLELEVMVLITIFNQNF